MSEILTLDDADWQPSEPGVQLRIQVVWVRVTADADWMEVGGWRYGLGDEDVSWAQVRVRKAALPWELVTARRHGRLGAELTGYHEADHGPRQLRVDIVDRGTLAVVASLTPGEALTLISEMLNAVAQARDDEP